jgi:hypothetical protein
MVVLARELMHAYTQLGRDIDGRRWFSSLLRDSEHAATQAAEVALTASANASTMTGNEPVAKQAVPNVNSA